ncbi:MAG: hypothetical protein JJU07_16415 [Natronohydrobacter sp.]|nr:hypothetical protein [Natronohydrobacter sp.]
MTHTMQTSVPMIERVNVATVLERRAPDLVAGADYTVTTFDHGDEFVRVLVHGNGAMLRDLAFALDVAGMLD